jgi:hypothetical protein
MRSVSTVDAAERLFRVLAGCLSWAAACGEAVFGSAP